MQHFKRSQLVEALIEIIPQLTHSELKELDKNRHFTETMDLLQLRAKQMKLLQKYRQLKNM